MREVTAWLLAYDKHYLQGGDEYQWESLELAKNYPNGYLIAVLLAQGVKAETFWRIPRLWKEEHDIDLSTCPLYKEKHWENLLREVGYRFPSTMAGYIYCAMRKLHDEYFGDAMNIWGNKATASEIYDRLIAFNGIGQKKASMTVNILFREGILDLKDKEKIDISYDKHIRQVLVRSGLAEEDTMDCIVQTARDEHPKYPGALDKPCWYIGQDWCFNENPACNFCPLTKVCEKKVEFIAR